ncbi:MAG: basic amino acid ABC transporter substrate-binding protein [FCB group bacterium]|nr:basic amino acid ABC transporter substrate-binding protein [FCB group bacterium]
MKILLLLLSCSLIVIGCSRQNNKNLSARTTLRIGTDATYPPFETINPETGKPEGFDIDLISSVCKINGWQPDFILTPFDGMIPGLNSKKYDVVISAMTITPQREAVVNFSRPYYLAGQSIAVPVNDSMIFAVKDLKGKRVGVQLGTTGELMAKNMDGVEVYSFDNIGAAFIDMDNGNLDAVLNDFPTTQTYIKRHHTAKIVGKILSEEHYGIAVRKTDTQLLEKINRALEKIKQSGQYSTLHIKWFGIPPLRKSNKDTTTIN